MSRDTVMEESTVSSSSDQTNPQKRPHPQVDRQQVLNRLCSQDGGFGVVCATVATLYRFQQPTEPTAESAESDEAKVDSQWKVIGYGIPAVMAERGSLVLSLGDLESDTDVQQFALESTSQYTALDEYFHVFLVHPRDSDEVQCYGLGFSDVAVAKKILNAVKQLVLCTDVPDETVPPPSKRSKIEGRVEDDWVVIEREDIPVLLGDDGGTDTPDSGLLSSLRGRKKSQEKAEPMDIGKPTDFKHISHVGKDTPIGEFTRVISGDLSESQKATSTEPVPIKQPEEPGTEISSSFSEKIAPPPPPAPPPPKVVPPPPAFTLPRAKGKPKPKKETNAQPAPTFGVSLEEILIRSSTLRPVSGRSKTLPRPPPKSDRTKLVFEIHTFSRTTLRHVSPKSKDSTDSHDEPLSIQALLKAGLEKMKNKLQSMTVVGNINSEGNEEGFEDEFDGALFVEE